jgi:hypothetical protein
MSAENSNIVGKGVSGIRALVGKSASIIFENLDYYIVGLL